MTGRLLLDTNILIAMLRSDRGVLDQLAASEGVFTSAVVLGELYFGARKSAHVEANLKRLEELAVWLPMTVCDRQTASVYGQIKQQQQAAGRPIPENDLWVAAHAVQYGATLVSRDAHFDAVSGLSRLEW